MTIVMCTTFLVSGNTMLIQLDRVSFLQELTFYREKGYRQQINKQKINYEDNSRNHVIANEW